MATDIAQRQSVVMERRNQLLNILNNDSLEQLTYRPSSGAWSTLQIAHHLLLSEQDAVTQITQRLNQQEPPPTVGVIGDLRVLVFVVIFGLNLPVQNPIPGASPSETITRQDVLSLFHRVTEDWKRLMAIADDHNRLNCALWTHPVAGDFNFMQTQRMNILHYDNHLRQIERLRR